MKRSSLYAAWGVLFLLCALLGFIESPEGAVRVLLTLLSLVFFLPPLVLLVRGDPADRLLLRHLAIASLGLTVVLLILNFLSIAASQAMGDFLHGLLVVLSAPMICSGNWVLSMFCWACVLFGTLVKGKSGK